jgi:hypothetical protein
VVELGVDDVPNADLKPDTELGGILTYLSALKLDLS